MSSPDYLYVDDSPPPTPAHTRSREGSDSAVHFCPEAMNIGASSTDQEHIIAKDDDVKELMPMGRQLNKVQTIQDSSDDEPIVVTRRRHNRRSSTHELSKTPSKEPAKKAVKQPGPSTSSSKHIMKNNMKAKKAVVKEIESYWGKNFIKSYIPKCHRPLVKRGIHSKRSSHRAHETDPKKYLPSVLKAILMIAKLTNNKIWLHQAMLSVVRYRIKNTGNRKPQLVTTDFDVIEDMLVKNWTVEYSFGIRYKHLLVGRRDQLADDEDVERILQVVGSDREGGEGSDQEVADQDGSSGASDSSSQDEDAKKRGGGGSRSYQRDSGYQQSPPSISRSKRHRKKVVKNEESPIHSRPPPPGQYGNYYNRPPAHQWGGPTMSPPQGYRGYGDYGRGSGGYNNDYLQYGQLQFPTQQHPHHRNTLAPSRQPTMTPSPSTPCLERHGRETLEIKRESPSAEDDRVNEFGSPVFFSRQGFTVEDAIVAEEDEDEDVNDLDAQVAAAEAELKLACLRAKRARMARK